MVTKKNFVTMWHFKPRQQCSGILKKSLVTYLNKGQTYYLTVADSTPPTKKAGFSKYRTFVHVSFEGEDQRSNPVASWQLWKEGRGLKEAYDRKGKVLAVEYVDLSHEDVKNQGHQQIQPEAAFVDGFCVTWTADSTASIYEAAIPLKFNFLSTDFSRSKGVKGIPVRLCAKTEMLRSVGEDKAVEDKPEMCYCVVKLFRDHGAERKYSNDKTRAQKMIEKLNKQIVDGMTGADFDRRSRNNSLLNGEKFDIRPQKKRRWSISSRNSSVSGKDLHADLAAMTQIISSARPLSVLGLRGNEKDDPDLYPICLSNGSSNSMGNGVLNNQYRSPDCQERPLKMPKVSIGTSQVGSATDASESCKYVACFYVQFTQSGKQPQGNHYAIYLADRTSLSLKAGLAEKLHIDPCFISHIIWVNRKGLKVLVDDNMVQHLPEAQIMIADICESSYRQVRMASPKAKCSGVEVKLIF